MNKPFPNKGPQIPHNGPQKKVSRHAVRRLMGYLAQYRLGLVAVVLAILISAGAGVASSLFLRTLIDDYISPLLLQAVPDFAGLFRAVLQMGGIYLIGVVSTYLYNRFMVVIAQGVL